MTRGEYFSDAAIRDRQRARVAALRTTQEQLEALGWSGQPGFMGIGTYGSDDRAAGYERSR